MSTMNFQMFKLVLEKAVRKTVLAEWWVFLFVAPFCTGHVIQMPSPRVVTRVVGAGDRKNALQLYASLWKQGA